MVNDVFAHGRKVVQPNPPPTAMPTMPVEFSVAAFRLGHSMIRPVYDWNRRFPRGVGFLDYMFQFSAAGGDLGGEDRLLSNWLADWRRMYDFAGGGHPDLDPPERVNLAQRIDTLMTDPLKNLPPSTFGGGAGIPFDDRRRNLAFRNLTRSSMVRLASGQQMVAKLRSSGVAVRPLTRRQILQGNDGAKLTGLTPVSGRSWSRTRRCGSTSCGRRRRATDDCGASARGSWRRRSIGPWRAADSRSCGSRSSVPGTAGETSSR